MKEERKYSLYIHKNKINGKCYVGITSKAPSKRWGNNGYHYNSQPFYNAIQKYGWDNFEHIIVLTELTKTEAESKEIEYILKLKSNKREFGYNMTSGGTLNDSAKLTVCQYSLTGDFINEYESITNASEITGIDISYIAKCCRKERLMAGYFLWAYKNEEPIIGYIKPEILKVCQYTLGCEYIKTYENAQIAESENNIYRGGVTDCCNKRQVTAGNFKWAYEGEVPQNNIPARIRKVHQYTLDGRYINTYSNPTDASKHTGIKRNNISNCCNKNFKSAGGYIFVYDGEELDLNIPKIKKRVFQYSKNGTLINEYNSTCDAFYRTGIRPSGISLCCNGKLKTAGGYIWRYENDN